MRRASVTANPIARFAPSARVKALSSISFLHLNHPEYAFRQIS